MNAPLPPNETRRLAALRDHAILDTPAEPAFDDIAALVAEICEVPIALITLVEEQRLWVKASVGLTLPELPREHAFCAHTVLGTDLLVVPDATEDARFAGNPLVTAGPRLRFYAGAPLVLPGGEALGALCVLDRVPRELNERQQRALRVLGRQVTTQMQLRRQIREQARAEQGLRHGEREQRLLAGQLLTQSQQLVEAQAVAKVGSWETDLTTLVVTWSEEIFRIFGLAPNSFQPTHERFLQCVHPDDRAAVAAAFTHSIHQPPAAWEIEHRVILPDGEVKFVAERWQLFEAEAGRARRAVGTCQDISERKRWELLHACEARVLEAVSAGASLPEILEKTAAGVEAVIPGALAAVMLVEAGGAALRIGAAPSLPTEFQRAMQEIALGESSGSCGAAAYRRAPVIAADLQTDPSWRDHRALAEAHGLRACWSVPVQEKNGQVIATFGVYHRQSRSPEPAELELIGRLVHIAGIAIERERKDRELRLLETSISRVNDIVLITEAEPQVEPGPRILYVNDAFVRRTGYTREEVIGKSPRFLQGPKTQRDELDRIRIALKKWQPVRAELINYKKSGEEFWLELEIMPVADATGWFTHFVAVERDITERKAADEALRESERRFRKTSEQLAKVLDSSLDVICTLDAEGRFVQVSAASERVWGYRPQELLGTPFIDLVHAGDVEKTRAIDARIMSGQPVNGFENRFVRKDGSVVHLMWSAWWSEADQSNFCVARDISEARRAAEELRRQSELLRDSEAQYRLLFADTPLPMWVFDSATLRFLAVNSAALDHYGYAEEEFLAMTIRDIRPTEGGEKIARELRDSTAPGKRVRRSRHAKRDGTVIEVEVTADDIVFDGQPARLVLINDITERVRTEREALRANRALRMLTRCNEALIRAESEQALLTEVCAIAVDEGGFRMAWVGYALDDPEFTIAPQAHAGFEENYLKEIRLSWSAESPSGRGPAARAIREGVPVCVTDLTDAGGGFYTVEEARARGYCGVACLPLKDGARVFGQLALYLGEVREVPGDELELLRELADDVAFGILNLRARAERRRTHEAVLAMARGVSASTGAEFFEKLVHNMIEALGAQAGFIAQALPDDSDRMHTVAVAVDGKTEPNFDYALTGAPCAELRHADLWIVPRDTHRLYPHAGSLVFPEVAAYVGVKLGGVGTRPPGLLVVQFRQPIAQTEFISSSLKIFATRVDAELQRQEAESRTREQAALLDKAQDAIIVRDLSHRITYWNKSAERRYGWTAAEVWGRSVREFLYEDPAAFDAAMHTVLKAGEWTGEFIHLRKDGKRVDIEGRWTLVRDETGRPKSILAINTDITERKRLEQQFLRAQRMESIGTLAGGIAHDLNNLLAPITMGVELLRRFEVNPKSLMLIDNMERSARRGADLVKQVLSFARGVQGARVALHVRHIIREVESITHNTFPKNITIERHVDADLWLVLADPTQLNQVLLNLCVNARDAMPDGGHLLLAASNAEIDAQYAVMHGGVAAGRYVMIQVSDTGCGMPQEVIDRIFEPFFTTKEPGKGTGLGLSTVMGIVRGHGGFVTVQSEPGKGSEFKVYLPAQTDASTVAASTEAPETLPHGKGELVLVVDDENSILDITKQTLQTFGYRVLTATDGAQAIGLYAAHRTEIALVLTDMMMPVMDGPALIAALRRVNPGVLVVATSGLNANAHLARTAGGGIKHFLAKPYSADELLTTLRQVLAAPGSMPPP